MHSSSQIEFRIAYPIQFLIILIAAPPVMVIDCTMNADCATNTDGTTVCVNKVCTGKSSL